MKKIDPRKLRLSLGMNQGDFWGRVGVTQSGGSRYEGSRRIPKPVKELLRVIYVERIDISAITRGDVAVLTYLKKAEPSLYRRLRLEAKRSPGRA